MGSEDEEFARVDWFDARGEWVVIDRHGSQIAWPNSGEHWERWDAEARRDTLNAAAEKWAEARVKKAFNQGYETGRVDEKTIGEVMKDKAVREAVNGTLEDAAALCDSHGAIWIAKTLRAKASREKG